MAMSNKLITPQEFADSIWETVKEHTKGMSAEEQEWFYQYVSLSYGVLLKHQ